LGLRDSNVLHWFFLHTLRWQVTNLCRRLAEQGPCWPANASTVGFRVYFILNASRYWGPWVIWAMLGVEAARGFRTAPEKFSTYVLIGISLCSSWFNGISAFRWVRKLPQSVRLKSGQTGVLKGRSTRVSKYRVVFRA
jgi:hypothetical protein